jgi:hypothetical protein
MKMICASVMGAFWMLCAAAHAEVSLKGTHESLVRENFEADQAGLARIENDVMLEMLKRSGELVSIEDALGVKADSRLEKKWAWVRPWTSEFLIDLGRGFHDAHKSTLLVSSAVRTDEYQGFLQLINKNAAMTSGARKSTHPTGATIDITKRYLTHKEIKWLRVQLLALEAQGLIEATEEFFQSVFHVMVLPRYSGLKVATGEDEVSEK